MATRRGLMSLLMRGGVPRKENPPTKMVSFNLPSGYVVTINEDGLSSISLGGTVLATGPFQLLDGSWYYLPFENRSRVPTISSKSFSTATSVIGATVVHQYTGVQTAKATYTYAISGNDILISVLLENNGATPIVKPAFKSPSILFDNLSAAKASGVGLGWDQGHTQASGENLSYPSTNVPYAVAYLTSFASGGKPINISLWSREDDPADKFMTMAVGFGGVAGTCLASFFFDNIQPGDSRTYKFAYRFSNSTDWKVLLQGYKDYLRAALPTLKYEPDARPVAQFARINTIYIRPDNPYGYQDGGNNISSRFDKLEGCQDYLSKMVPPMVDVNYQGIVFWQLQGIHPRGVQYRPDFNVFPPETIPNLPTLTSGFNNAGLNIGLLARPKSVITSNTWTTDGLIRITDYSESVLDLTNRLQWALANNFKGFYLDSFITDGPDHGILKAIRNTLGPSIHTFCEFSTSLSMAYSAVYTEITWSGGIVLGQKQQILRWLWPESIIAAKFVGSLPAGGYTQLYTDMFDLKLTPLVGDDQIIPNASGTNTALKPLVATRIGADHKWL